MPSSVRLAFKTSGWEDDVKVFNWVVNSSPVISLWSRRFSSAMSRMFHSDWACLIKRMLVSVSEDFIFKDFFDS